MDEPVDTIFQESEVLWAKIRGYPWWPAYVNRLKMQVSEVHFAQAPQDYQYTVIFFGDNTNSRLGPSKLRKFPDFYAECYAKSKTHKKLKQSIDRAQERLNQNNQDVTIYQGIRNEMKLGKKKKGTMSQSRLSSSQKGEGIDPPELVKYKTDVGRKAPTSKNKQDKNQIFQNSESQKQQQSEKSIQCNNILTTKKNVTQFHRRKSQIVRLNPHGSPIKPVSVSVSQQQLPNVRSRRSCRGSKQVVEPISNQKQKTVSRSKQKIQVEQQEQQKQQSLEQEQQQQSKQKITAKPQNPRIRRGRKGRPSKLQQIERQKQKQAKQAEQQHVSQQQQAEQQKQKTPILPQSPQKRGRKKNNAHNRLMHVNKVSVDTENKTQQQIGTLTEKQAQKIKNSLNNRKQLIKVLLEMPINVGNIKQILDLGVSLILQQGPITKSVYLLLCTLKATLLHKYFPDDNKHRRKYEKMTKQKRKIMMHEDYEDQEQQMHLNSEQQNNIKMQDEKVQHEQKTQQKLQQKNRNDQSKKKEKDRKKQKEKQKQKQKQAQQQGQGQQKQKLQQIRMKANAKLQKMIRKAGLQQGAKQLALKIQNTFQDTAQAKGDLYRTIAYQRMRTIKTKLGEFSQKKVNAYEIKHYLQQLLHTYHTEGTNKYSHR